MTKGRVVSIHISRAAGAPIEQVELLRAIAGQGLEGDRYFTKSGHWSGTAGATRDVTLIEAEAVEGMNAKLGTDFAAAAMRRNVVTRGVRLNHLVSREFRVGEAKLRGTGLCQPCTYLEGLTRSGVKAAMQNCGGLRAAILEGGTIRAGDALLLLEDPAEQSKDLVRRYYEELWNPWDFGKAEELLAADIVFRGSLGAETRGRERFSDYMRQVQRAFPDFHNTVEQIVAEDERAVARLAYRGTHRGEIFGVAPTGKRIEYAGAAFFRIAHGKIAEGWVLGDLLTLLRQLGARSLP
jgi:steroid delta-isomerase-like uncharacterized protein